MMLSDMPMYYAGGGFPWGLLIIGGIVYFLWTKGVFDGRGRFSNGGRFGGFGPGYGPAQGLRVPGTDPALVRGGKHSRLQRPARDVQWHRQAHETGGAPSQAQASATPPAPPTPPAAPTEAPASGDGEPAR